MKILTTTLISAYNQSLLRLNEIAVATQLIRGIYNLSQQFQGCVATIGNFDGVHKGHQALLERVKQKAKILAVPSVLITFEPQPGEFFTKSGSLIPRLTRWREKFHALAACDIDAVLVLRFNKDLAELTAGAFIQKILVDGLAVKHVVVGDDFRFGKSRQGDFNFLQQAGLSVESMPSVTIEGERVSSTRIRLALQNKQHALVEKLLGHPYFMEGRVVYGDRRGRTMGFPTANILLHRQVTPVSGVYAVKMHGVSSQPLRGVANVGVRPTVDGTRSLLEVHLFDFDQDIYKRQVKVEFCEKLRDEKRFESLDLLIEQIWRDARDAREYFDKNFKN
jgi:riboflavin kinase/FMN adenylyltransferase